MLVIISDVVVTQVLIAEYLPSILRAILNDSPNNSENVEHIKPNISYEIIALRIFSSGIVSCSPTHIGLLMPNDNLIINTLIHMGKCDIYPEKENRPKILKKIIRKLLECI